ncbi:MAG TPA: hypothetical protein VNZ22_07925 [Bacillota bacterium]|nr:hypothetical protein [Bacillota bacterium]
MALLSGLVWLAGAGQGWAADSGLAQKTYWESREHFKQQPQNLETAWQFGRACFDLAEFATNSTERAELAEQGIAACKEAVARASKSAPAHYYLAMNQGQLARTRSLGALKLVDEMEREFSKAGELDAHFDYAGPDRNLGYLYRDAPSFGSIGSRSKARQHFERAVALAPEYPENHLALLEAFMKWGDRNGAVRTLKDLEGVWPAARQQFSGPAWAASWADWEARLDKEKQKLEARSKALESPRGRQ